MLCPRCSSIFDKKDAKHIQGVRAVKAKWGTNAQPKMDPEDRYDPRRGHQKGPMNQVRRPPTYRPLTNVPVGTWLNTVGRKRPNEEKWRTFDVPRGSSLDYRKEYHTTTTNKVDHISSNYKGKNPVSLPMEKISKTAESRERGCSRASPRI